MTTMIAAARLCWRVAAAGCCERCFERVLLRYALFSAGHGMVGARIRGSGCATRWRDVGRSRWSKLHQRLVGYFLRERCSAVGAVRLRKACRRLCVASWVQRAQSHLSTVQWSASAPRGPSVVSVLVVLFPLVPHDCVAARTCLANKARCSD